jgi:hypothetical protein
VGIAVLSKADIASTCRFKTGVWLISRRDGEFQEGSAPFLQPSDYISVDYASETGTMVSLRMGRVTERSWSLLARQLGWNWVFRQCVRTRTPDL